MVKFLEKVMDHSIHPLKTSLPSDCDCWALERFTCGNDNYNHHCLKLVHYCILRILVVVS